VVKPRQPAGRAPTPPPVAGTPSKPPRQYVSDVIAVFEECAPSARAAHFERLVPPQPDWLRPSVKRQVREHFERLLAMARTIEAAPDFAATRPGSAARKIALERELTKWPPAARRFLRRRLGATERGPQ